ncbi:hypothetical protein BKA66DRAFT_544597, partial [Pyrenochaeta sp. MPI-SDFR-AT-0127]
MALHLLGLPHELLVQILASLPVRVLLKFAQTSRLAQSLANSNLHTLKLGIHPIRSVSLTHTKETTEYTPPQYRASALVEQPSALPPREFYRDFSHFSGGRSQERCGNGTNNDKIWVRILDVRTYEYSILFKFNTALVRSIILRHRNMLQTVDLSLWTLTVPIAEVIARLTALRSLSIMLEDNLYARAVPQSYMASEHQEQRRAWKQLVQNAVWRDELHTLHVESANITTSQLSKLLQGNHRCREIQLRRCRYVGNELWMFLSKEWQGSAALRTLIVADCGGVMNVATMNMIRRLNGLQFLDLQGCHGLNGITVEQWDRNLCHIP